MSFQDKAMLVELRVSMWSAHKLDKGVTNDVLSRKSAASGAGRFNKALLPDSPLLKAVRSAERAARKALYAYTLPWSQDGLRILPAATYLRFTREIRARQREFDQAVEGFLNQYGLEVTLARERLGDMFDIGDYPPNEQLRKQFALSVEVLPFPDGSDFRVEMAATDAEEIRVSIEERVKREIDAGQADLWARLRGVVDRMIERLSDPEAIFRDTLVENVQDLVELLPSLNIAGDQRLAEITGQCNRDLMRYTAQELRDNPVARASTAAKARDIVSQMSGYM